MMRVYMTMKKILVLDMNPRTIMMRTKTLIMKEKITKATLKNTEVTLIILLYIADFLFFVILCFNL